MTTGIVTFVRPSFFFVLKFFARGQHISANQVA